MNDQSQLLYEEMLRRSPDIFRRHERFDWKIEYTEAASDAWIMHVFEKDTGIEVAGL